MNIAGTTKETEMLLPPATESAAGKSMPQDNLWQRIKKGVSTKITTTRKFARELWDEHDLLVNTAAMKGGATAVALAGAVVLSYAVALPVVFAVTGVIVAATMIGLGAYGVLSGGIFVIDRVKAVYRHATGKDPDFKPGQHPKTIREKIKEGKLVKKFLNSKFGQKVTKSHAWQVANKFTKKQDAFMAWLALGGSAASITMGAVLIASQVTILPIIAIGAGMVLTTYMTVHGVIDHVRIQKEKRAAEAAAKEAAAPAAAASAVEVSAAPAFEAKGKKPSLAARFKNCIHIGRKKSTTEKTVTPAIQPPAAAV